MISTMLIRAVIVGGAFVLASSVQAQYAGFYAGGGIGQSDAKDACDPANLVGFVGSCDDTDTSWKVFGGYQINRWFGVELGYVDLGEVSATGTFGGVPVTASTEGTTIEFVGVGTFPFNDEFAVIGKLGLHRWDVDSNITATGLGGASVSDDGIDLTYGVGLQWNFVKNASARLEWQRYNDVGDSNTTVDVLGVSVLFRF